MQELNIVELIEKNPMTKLSDSYNNKLLNRIKEHFSSFEQQLFVGSFYCYLNYNKNTDFVVDLDNIWCWLGFNQKFNAIRLIEKFFTVDIDYKNLAPLLGGARLGEEKWGGQNIKKYFLTINCFKSLCLKSQTKKAGEIHNYYIKLEEILHEIIEEETTELKLQLEKKENIILEIRQTAEEAKNLLKKEKNNAVEEAFIIQFPLNTECIYFGTIDNTNEANEKLIKFGHTNDLTTRITDHKKKYTNFILVNAFRVQNKVEIENLIKNYPKIKGQIRNIVVNGKNKTEIIAYDDNKFTIDKLSKHIKDIIHSKTYSIDNFNRITKENEELKCENNEVREQLQYYKLLSEKREIEMNDLREKLETKEKIIESFQIENQSVYQNVLLPEDDLNKKFNEFVNSICIVRPDVEELSVNIEGRYRLWNRVKPTKEVFHALKNYMDIRFKPKRIEGNHGYLGIKLKPVEYKKTSENSTVETFIFQMCKFSDCGKILNTVLLSEYRKWKISVDKELTDNDMKDIKEYLNETLYVLKATVWTDDGSNEGYYGLSLKETNYKPTYISSTGKTVYKRERENNQILAKWPSIVKASQSECIPPSKMSRCIKNKTIINDYYFSVT